MEEKDLGVTLTKSLSPGKHLNKIIRETCNLLGKVRAAFAYLDEDMVRKMVVMLIGPKLEYAAVVWLP